MICLCLQSIDAWGFVEGAVDKPKEVDVALFYKALAIIASAVGPKLSYLVLTNDEVLESSTPHWLWSNIKAYFNLRSKKNLSCLKCQVFAVKIKLDEEILKFIACEYAS